MHKIKAEVFWWDNLLILMLLPSVWVAAVLGSCCGRAAAPWLLQPRRQRAHSLGTAPAQLALPAACLGLQLPLLGGLLGEHWAASAFGSLKCTLFRRVAHFLVSARQNVTQWEMRAHGPGCTRHGAQEGSLDLLISRESWQAAEHGWVRAQSYQRQQASSGKANKAKGHVDNAYP